MPLRKGEMFAGYEVVRLLGSGGMGEVYLVRHPRLQRDEALKVLRADVDTVNDGLRARFLQEANLAAKLAHPNIVGVYDCGEYEGRLWISMAYIDGLDTARLLKTRYPAGFVRDDVIKIVAAVADALDYAHSRDLLHRDVKPANILVTDSHPGQRRVFLADFGIARGLEDSGGLTATNMVVGTLGYAAPEQLTGARIDGRADQYALAATAFQLFTGEHMAVGSCLGAIKPELTSLDTVIRKALAPAPGDRFPNCRDFAAALAECAQSDRPTWDAGTAAAVRKPQPPPAAPLEPNADTYRQQKPLLRASVLAPIIGIAVLLAGIALVQKYSGTSDSDTARASQLAWTTPSLPMGTTPISTSVPWATAHTVTETTTIATTTTTTSGVRPYWDGSWLRDFSDPVGNCFNYWVVQPGTEPGMYALKHGCVPEDWKQALGDHCRSYPLPAGKCAVWDQDSILSEIGKRGDLRTVAITQACLDRAHLTDFHEGPIHTDCVVPAS
ncbi:serine/threonine protein kinase [Mycobacteroides saopaulense]|uniref:non-specific serine/threonine protein kinase n=1 Tax=Mycobacteroides saopaulense TaxID=1578165 RepID=A0A1X0J4B8_9MYCO|nr:serine/threonine-protein kinase [Mycobacteroides saopaulense]ORB56757.1 serine/threonine protein kinase [Mycobacteroides saopaulense]